jgi:hypothetical protein
VNVRLFGLEVDASGALRTIRQVGESGATMARDGAKSAQLYADAFRERMNRVAREYIPETMRAIDALQERHRALGASQQRLAALPIPGVLTASEVDAAVVKYDKMIAAMRDVEGATNKATAAHEPHIMGLSRIGNGLSSLIGHATGVPPVFERIGDAIGIMAIGHLATVGVLAGFAAIAFGWEKLTEKAREATKAQDEAIKRFDELAKRRGFGAGGETVEQVRLMRERVGTDRARIESLQQTPVDAFAAGKGIAPTANTAAIAARATEITKLQANIAEGERLIAEAVAKAGQDMTDRQVSDLAALIAAHKATAGEIRNATLLVQGFTQSLNAMSGDGSKASERAKLIGQIKDLNDALNPKKEAADAARQAARDAKEAQDIADKQANARNQLVIDGIKRRAAERAKAEKEAAKEAQKAIDASASAVGDELIERLRQQKVQEKYADDMRKIWLHGIDRIVTDGLRSFRGFFEEVLSMFTRLMARMEAEGKDSGFGYNALKLGASAIGGGMAGFSLGQQFYSSSHSGGGNTVRGAVGGTLAGALAGTAIAPGIGTAVGAMAGFVGGILGVGSAAKDAARQMADAVKQVTLSTAALRADVAHDTVAAGIAAIEADRAARIKAVEDAWSGGGAGSDRVLWRTAREKEINALEDERIAKLKEEYALSQTYAREDLEVRKLRAEGHAKEADAMARQDAADREIAQAIADHRSDEYIATLRYVTGLELATNAMDKATSSALNMVEGYKLQAAVFRVMAAGPATQSVGGAYAGASYSGPIRPPTGPARGTPQPTDPVTLQPLVLTVDGRVLAEGMLKQYGAGQTGGNLKVAFGALVQRAIPE